MPLLPLHTDVAPHAHELAMAPIVIGAALFTAAVIAAVIVIRRKA